ncbi:MAG: NAD(P)/FAD-dependent oxidoreductase [Vicinamibacterales bacterium]
MASFGYDRSPEEAPISEAVDVVIVGGGVTGLAAAGEIAAAGRSVVVLERHPRPGMEMSTHNSAVIHAGLYYPPNSLKGTLCLEGAERLYAFCEQHDVPHDQCGKFVVASEPEEIPILERLKLGAEANGVKNVSIVGEAEVRKREPKIRAAAAMWSPRSGRVEAEALVRTLRKIAASRDAIVLCGTPLVDADCKPDGFALRTERETILARSVVNAAGLYADDVSRMLGGESFRIYPVRGEYAELKTARSSWLNGLVYPLPHASGHGLGVHFTKTVGGRVMLGPTAHYQQEKDDYERNRLPLEHFLESAKLLMPDLTLDDLTYGGTGIRAKLHPPEEKFADFIIRRDARQPALIQAAGIESPGLTACLAVGARIASLVKEVLA